eukprot:scaffold67641_cov15-Prasinocladus_malaysianus.AAC.1
MIYTVCAGPLTAYVLLASVIPPIDTATRTQARRSRTAAKPYQAAFCPVTEQKRKACETAKRANKYPFAPCCVSVHQESHS